MKSISQDRLLRMWPASSYKFPKSFVQKWSHVFCCGGLSEVWESHWIEGNYLWDDKITIKQNLYLIYQRYQMSDSDVIHQYRGPEKVKISTLDDRGDIILNEPEDIKSKQVCVCVCL